MSEMGSTQNAETEAIRLAAISAEIREYLSAETDVTSPSFHATAITHRIAHLLNPPGQSTPEERP